MPTRNAPFFDLQFPGGSHIIAAADRMPGKVFFVHSGTGTDAAGYGQNPDAPVASVDYAIGLCTADKNDVILVMPGHAETITNTARWTVDVAGVTIKGLGNGTNRPRVTVSSSAAADVDIDAANVTVEGIDFLANFADITALIDVNADGFTCRNCRFFEQTNLNFLVCIQDAAAGGSDFITVEDCVAFCPDAANTHFVNFAGTGDGHIVRRNILVGDWGTTAIGGAGVITNCYIVDNDISNKATDNDACINLAATATGIVMRNMACGGAAQANGITATGTAQAENYYGVISEDLQAILDPIVT